MLGGYINQYTDWRWTFYVLLLWSGVQLTLIVAFVPETYHPVILRRKAIAFRTQTGEQRWHAPIEKLDRSVASTVMWSCIRPFQLLFLEPMVSRIFCRLPCPELRFAQFKRAFALDTYERTIVMKITMVHFIS